MEIQQYIASAARAPAAPARAGISAWGRARTYSPTPSAEGEASGSEENKRTAKGQHGDSKGTQQEDTAKGQQEERRTVLGDGSRQKDRRTL